MDFSYQLYSSRNFPPIDDVLGHFRPTRAIDEDKAVDVLRGVTMKHTDRAIDALFPVHRLGVLHRVRRERKLPAPCPRP